MGSCHPKGLPAPGGYGPDRVLDRAYREAPPPGRQPDRSTSPARHGGTAQGGVVPDPTRTLIHALLSTHTLPRFPTSRAARQL